MTQLPPGKVHSHQHTTQEPRNEGWEGPRDDKTRALGADRQVAPSGSTRVFRLWLFCLLRPSIYWLYWSLCYSLVLPLYQRPEIDSRKDLKTLYQDNNQPFSFNRRYKIWLRSLLELLLSFLSFFFSVFSWDRVTVLPKVFFNSQSSCLKLSAVCCGWTCVCMCVCATTPHLATFVVFSESCFYKLG